MNQNTGILPAESVTKWLLKWREGDDEALAELTRLVYGDLRRLARSYLRNERTEHTLEPTALVHEAYLQMLGFKDIEWKNRAQFIAILAQIMRRVLVDHARRNGAQKRGGDVIKLPISRVQPSDGGAAVNLIELNDALDKFAAQSEKSRRKAHVVELFYFGGLSVIEIASLLSETGTSVSPGTVEKDLKFARAWLFNALKNT